MMIIVIKDGQIINVASPLPINNPEEGVQADGTYILYVNDLEGLEPNQFIDQRYWDGTSLQTRSPRPSLFCAWTGSSWTVDEINYLKQVRFERDMLLYRCDWTQIPDAPLTSEQVAESATYRQALRDMTDPVIANPQAYTTIESAPWPTPPSFLNVS